MPPVAIAAGIGAAGSILGGVISSGGARRAAQTQADSSAAQIAALRENRDYISGIEQPTINRGNQAGDLYGNFVGLNGGTAAADALSTFRGSTGYNDLVGEGLGAVNSNAYARGQGNSGATLKALQRTGMSLADRSSSDWLNRLNTLMQTGNAAIGNISGVATNTTAGINAANQTTADARGASQQISSNNFANGIQSLFNAGGAALTSSYQQPSFAKNIFDTVPGYGGPTNQPQPWYSNVQGGRGF